MQGNCYIDKKGPRNKTNRKVNKNDLISKIIEAKVTLIINQDHIINRSHDHDITPNARSYSNSNSTQPWLAFLY